MNLDVTFNETDSNFDVDFGNSNSASSTNDHSQLINRNKAGQHPISAITGLEETLNDKMDSSELPTAIDTALAQAKESGEFDGTNGADGKSPYIAENGNWVVWDADINEYVDTGVSASQEEQVEKNTQNVGELKSRMDDAEENIDSHENRLNDIDESIGDVGAALEYIISLQNSYIGGDV